jgi:broad specificity phosphatase PhoE
VSTAIVFETHSISEDNEAGLASGWTHGPLSTHGRDLARQLGDRRRNDRLAVVFASDLRRAVETATLAFDGTDIPVLLDWRLRECDYGTWTRQTAAEVHGARAGHLDTPYPGGESWRAAVARVGWFLDDVARRWRDARVLVIGHVATRWAFDHWCRGIPLEALVTEDFVWQEGWEYTTTSPRREPPAATAWIHPDTVIDASSIAGRGLFATAALPAGTTVLRLGGRLLSSDELDALFAAAAEDPDAPYIDTFSVTRDLHIVLPDGTAAHFANHSCDPNVERAGAFGFVARRDIAAGDELTIDYGLISGAEGFRMDCTCGSTRCRGVISSDDWQELDA